MRKTNLLKIAGLVLATSVPLAAQAEEGCLEQLEALAPQLTSSSGLDQGQTKKAVELYQQAQAVCDSGDEIGAGELIIQIETVIGGAA